MSILKEILEVGSVTDYSEPKQEKQLRNRAIILSTTMFFLWGAGMYKAHIRCFPRSVQVVMLLLGSMIVFTILNSALVKVWFNHGAASRERLWGAWRLQQGAAGAAFVGISIIFVSWAITHW